MRRKARAFVAWSGDAPIRQIHRLRNVYETFNIDADARVRVERDYMTSAYLHGADDLQRRTLCLSVSRGTEPTSCSLE